MQLSVRVPLTAIIAVLFAAAAVLLLAAATTTSAATPNIHGDANCDGVVDARDALAVLTDDAGIEIADQECEQDGGEVTCDDAVDSRDVMVILDYAADPAEYDYQNCFKIGFAIGDITPTPTTPTPTPLTPTPSESPTITPTGGSSETPTETSSSETPSITPTLTPTPTATPTETPSPTPTATPSPAPTPTPTLTPAPQCGFLSQITGAEGTPVVQGAAIPAGVGGTPVAGNYQMSLLPADVKNIDKLDGVYPVPGDPSLAIVTTETGMIYSICLYNGRVRTTVGDFTDVVRDFHGANDSDEGLLGFAFQPGDPSYVYINYSNPPDKPSQSPAVYSYNYTPGANVVHNHIAGYQIINGQIDRGHEKTILDVAQPWEWHNVEGLVFGPNDGMLYIGSGDGGSGNGVRGQTLDDLLGAILRIDVTKGQTGYTIPIDNPFASIPEAEPELWAIGLRNPWRLSFDSATGKMYFTDAGEKTYEEVDIGAPAANYGWNIMEGDSCYSSTTPVPSCSTAGLTTPIATYSHTSGNCVITGGQVYRGAAMPELDGYFIYGDFCSGRIWAVDTANPGQAPILLIDRQAGSDQLHPVSWSITSTGDIVMVDYTRAGTPYQGQSGIYVLQHKP